MPQMPHGKIGSPSHTHSSPAAEGQDKNKFDVPSFQNSSFPVRHSSFNWMLGVFLPRRPQSLNDLGINPIWVATVLGLSV